ncbi:MAG TPA: nucleotidyltransferase domain-containing protein [Anaerolineaceae bacterium]|nr:nucleotidyltransferase domain-containing protein [Anaerolineaceae bacterium]HPN52112.1 nucleotidyltransferase domain-containing protein [Anaerolineaceae bacterium]
MTQENDHHFFPVGTQVVVQTDIKDASGEMAVLAGAVGVVLRVLSTQPALYLVRLANGIEQPVAPTGLTVRKQMAASGVFELGEETLSGVDLYQKVIYRCVVGSRAYGLDHDASDTDRRGIYLPPAELHWSLFGVPEQLERPESEECYWELQKFINLALRANPNVLECLYTPLVEMATPLAQELLAQRDIFLSRFVYQTYNGYVLSQFKKLEQDLRVRGEIRWKHAMHLIRLLLSGITILNEGFVPVRVDGWREPLLEIRFGRMPWEKVDAWRLKLHREFEAAYQTTRLPMQPDTAAANRFLVRARRSQVQ